VRERSLDGFDTHWVEGKKTVQKFIDFISSKFGAEKKPAFKKTGVLTKKLQQNF